jgi:hypothetical protein
LTGLIFSARGQTPMVGRAVGTRRKLRRYYFEHTPTDPASGSRCQGVSAQHVEDGVICGLRTLCDQRRQGNNPAQLWIMLTDVLDIIEGERRTGVDLHRWPSCSIFRKLVHTLIERVIFDPDRQELKTICRLPPAHATGLAAA